VQFRERVQTEAVQFRSDTYGVHPIYAAFAQGSVALWFHGRPDQARAYAEQGLAHAEKSGQPFEIASGLSYLALIHLLSRNTDAVAALAARAVAVAREHDLAFFLPRSRFLGGAARVEHGDVEGGLSEMVESLAAQRAISGRFLVDLMLAFIATAHGRVGHWDDALRCADEGIALTETSLERIFTAELWRIKGELLLGKAQATRRGPSAITAAAAAAEPCLRRALEIAGQQEAASLALRAAMSLTRLSRGRGRDRDARDLLRAAYASFSEGFDTRDLKDARALLDTGK
jgi:adenylate cyclase